MTQDLRHPVHEWEWFGSPAHFICARDCRFHMATRVGPWLVSTVGQLLFDASSREALAESRGVTLVGKGDMRRASYMDQIGYEDIGYNRKYETMVFRAGAPCTADGCGCGLPSISGRQLDFEGYNGVADAQDGHRRLCLKWASKSSDAYDAEAGEDA